MEEFNTDESMIVWDVEDWSILKDLDPHVVVEKIRSDLYDMGYLGPSPLFRAFIDDDIPQDLLDVYRRSQFVIYRVPKGNKHARVHKLTVQILLWAMYSYTDRPSNLFILSENTTKDKQVTSLIKGLNEKKNYNVVVLEDLRCLLVDCGSSPATPIKCDCCGLPIKKELDVRGSGCIQRERPKVGRRGGRPEKSPMSSLAAETMSADKSMSSDRASSHVDDPYSAEIYAKGNTGVFWDVVNFPIPESDPDLISKQIRSDLKDKGCYNGPVSIRLYDYEDEKNNRSQALIDKYEAAGISINFVPEVAEAYGHARDHKMLVDILWWAVESPRESNLIILSKNLMKEEATDSTIAGLHFRGINLLLTEPSEVLPFSESSAWLWDSLCRSLGSRAEAHK